ncbi:MAG TPA: transglycosylase domain-containing protein [Thermoleophilaceae bacterium]
MLLGLAVVLSMAIIAGLGVVGYILAIAASAPNVDELKPIVKGSTSKIYAADGRLLGYVQSDQIRTPIRWSQMPPIIRNATVAIEDQRFYHHGGVDYEGIVRAAIRDVASGKPLQGGSTITQQLVRNLYIRSPKRDLKRKIREAKMAQELEQKHSKNWVLMQYLNDVPYGTVNGRSAIGVEAASQVYFNKHAQDLTLDEAALLAGLPQAPSDYSPFTNPAAALGRRNEVLQRMYTNHYITRQQLLTAEKRSLGLHPGKRYLTRHEPYFFDYVQDQLIQKYGANVFRQGGLRVYTTIEPNLQNEARAAIAGQLNLPTDPSSAIVTIDPSNGHILTMASSGTYKGRQFNLAAQGHRQPGSSFKTFVLTTAIKEGVNPNTTTYVSKPLNLNDPKYGPWQVKTFGNDYLGRTNLVNATLHSDNTVYAQLDLDVGPDKVAQTAKSMGITTHLNGYPAEGLGGLRLGVSPLEMADAYATLASGGVHHKPVAITKVVFPDGKVDNLGRNPGNRVLTDGQAYEVTKILHENVLAGTGTHANIGCPAAGKTGTTDNFNDAWFVGYTPKLATAVWVGYPNALIQMTNVHGISVQGGSFPAQIWHDYMNVAHGSFCGDFPQPTTPVQWAPFYGHYATTGATGPSYPTTGVPAPSAPSTGGTAPGSYKGYDPRLYASPPQGAPKTQSPSPTPHNHTPGGGNGNGNGNSGGGSPADPTPSG